MVAARLTHWLSRIEPAYRADTPRDRGSAVEKLIRREPEIGARMVRDLAGLMARHLTDSPPERTTR